MYISASAAGSRILTDTDDEPPPVAVLKGLSRRTSRRRCRRCPDAAHRQSARGTCLRSTMTSSAANDGRQSFVKCSSSFPRTPAIRGIEGNSRIVCFTTLHFDLSNYVKEVAASLSIAAAAAANRRRLIAAPTVRTQDQTAVEFLRFSVFDAQTCS